MSFVYSVQNHTADGPQKTRVSAFYKTEPEFQQALKDEGLSELQIEELYRKLTARFPLDNIYREFKIVAHPMDIARR